MFYLTVKRSIHFIFFKRTTSIFEMAGWIEVPLRTTLLFRKDLGFIDLTGMKKK